MQIKLIILDLDGTLLNTLEDLADSGNYMLSRYGFPQHPLSSYRYFVGNGIQKLVERILPYDKRELAFILKFKKEFITYYDLHKSDKTTPYSGIIPLLENLQKRKIKLAVASNKSHEVMHDLMRFYFPTVTFSTVLGQRPEIPTKPDPRIVYDILEITQIAKENTLYVGDTSVDILTAKNAGLKSVGVLWGFRDRDELIQSGADAIIQKPDELINFL